MNHLDVIAQQCAEVRNAANWAEGIATNLRKLNSGPVFDHERTKLIEQIGVAFTALSKFLGKEPSQ